MSEIDRFLCCQSAQIQRTEPNETAHTLSHTHTEHRQNCILLYQPTLAHDKSFLFLACIHSNICGMCRLKKSKIEIVVVRQLHLWVVFFGRKIANGWLCVWRRMFAYTTSKPPKKENANERFCCCYEKKSVSIVPSQEKWRFRRKKMKFASASSMIFSIFYETLNWIEYIWTRTFSNFHEEQN